MYLHSLSVRYLYYTYQELSWKLSLLLYENLPRFDRLPSSDLLFVPKVNNTFVTRILYVAASTFWNVLSSNVR